MCVSPFVTVLLITDRAHQRNHSSGNQRTAIIGAVVGSILGVAILAVAILVLMRTKTKHKVIDEVGPKAITPFEFGNEVSSGDEPFNKVADRSI